MGFRNDITAMLAAKDDLLGLDGFDMRPTSVTIVTRVWSNGFVGRGTSTDTVHLVLPSSIKVRHMSQREIASSGGRYEEGTVIAGPIRPTFTDPDTGQPGGYTEAQLDPKAQSGTQIVYKLEQQDPTASGITGDYRLIEFRRDRSWRFFVVVGRMRVSR